MTLIAKTSIALLSTISFVGVSYGVFSYLQKGTTIKNLINQRFEYVLLNTTKDSENSDKTFWDTNWNNYKNESLKRENDIFGLEGWTKNSTPNLTEKLKEKCSELITKIVYDNTKELYDDITKVLC